MKPPTDVYAKDVQNALDRLERIYEEFLRDLDVGRIQDLQEKRKEKHT